MSPDQPVHLVFGSSGQLGYELARALEPQGRVVALSRPEVDFLRPETAVAAVERHRPAIVWNCAAATAVDALESDRELAFRVNANAPGAIAEAARRSGAVLVHFSTDYVFDGTKAEPYVETDEPHPLNVYGASKLAGEEAVRAAGGLWLILRTSWVYSARGRNFLRTIARKGLLPEPLRVVDDQIGAPTEASQVAAACIAIIPGVLGPRAAERAGLYHLAATGETSWYGFACAIRETLLDLGVPWLAEVIPVRSAESEYAAQRPANSRLACARFASGFGVSLGPWHEGLHHLLRTSEVSSLSEEHPP